MFRSSFCSLVGCHCASKANLTFDWNSHRQIKDKKLLFKYIFESHKDALGQPLNCHSLDKYMSVDAWTNLYEKIAKSVDRYVANEAKMPSKEKISMRHAQMELEVSWQKCDALHLSMLELEPSEVYTYFMVVKTNAVSKVNEFMKMRSAKSKHDDSKKNRDLMPSGSNRCQSIVVVSTENTTDSSENAKAKATAPAAETGESLVTVCLDESSDEIEAKQRVSKAAGSIDLISRLPRCPRKAKTDTINLDENYCDVSYDLDDSAGTKNVMKQSGILAEKFSQLLNNQKLSGKRNIQQVKSAVKDDMEIKKKRPNTAQTDTSKRIEKVTIKDAPIVAARKKLM